MEITMIRANINDDREATMARFLAGLNPEIRYAVELHHYVELDEMAHMAIKIEGQVKRRGYGGRTTPTSARASTSNVAMGEQSGDKSSSSSNDTRVVPRAPTETPPAARGASPPATNTRGRDRRCFRCQGFGHIASECTNQRAMIVRPVEEEDFGERMDEEIEMEPKDEKEFREEVVLPDKLVLMAQPLSGYTDSQRENLFFTRVTIKDRVGVVTIDGGSCANLASTLLVQKLGLPTQRHPKPYGMKWINGMIIPRVEEQAWVPFSIEWYADVVLCDVIPMHTCHMLLGRPWQYDRGVYHDGRKNTYSFRFNNLVLFLLPLSFAQIKADELGIKTASVSQSNDLLIPQPNPSTCEVYQEANRLGREDEDLRTNLFQEGEYDASSDTH